ncbi:hypothetical protein P4V64_05250 [Bacillus thuringiensis]|nr:hypothetical protein [Bacillus thuringiensis]
MSRIDKRNRLDENPFHYRIAKDQTVFIDYQGKLVKTLKGKEAERFLDKLHTVEDDKTVQLHIAKITGNFKRGNERNGRDH